MKLAAQRQGSKAPAGISRSRYEKTIKEHQRAHGAYHGGEPKWLGQRGRVGHTVGLITGQGPTAHVNAARHWPTKIEGVNVPGAAVRRVMGYTHGGKTGLAVGAATTALGGGTALAAVHHHLKKVDMAPSPFLVEDIVKYTPGTITLHHEQAQMHARKKASASRGIGYGVGAAGVGAGAALGAEGIGREIGGRMTATTMGHRAANIKQATKLTRRGGIGLAAGGALFAGGSLARRMHHGRKQNVETRLAQEARVKRNADIGKSAFGVVHVIEKDDDRSSGKPSAGRSVATYFGAPVHGLVAGRKGQKLKAAGSELGHGIAGNAIGTGVGLGINAATHGAIGHAGIRAAGVAGTTAGLLQSASANNRKGRYKPQKKKEPAAVAKSVFGIEHEIEKAGLGSVIDGGIKAMKGVKSGLTATPGVARSASEANGVMAGGAARNVLNAGAGKLKPLGQMAQSNPGKTALLGGGGAGIGAVIGRKSKS